MTTERTPSEWKRVPLKLSCFKPEYGYTASASEKPIGPKFLRITDIQNGNVDWEKVPYVKTPDEGGRDYFLETGDIVIARIGATTGKAYLINKCPEAIFASYLIRIRTRPGLLPEFLNFCLQTEDYWRHINSRKGGRLKGGVNLPILENLEIPLPSPLEQEAIARVLNSVQKAKEQRLRELAKEEERKAALMEYLFTNGIRGGKQKDTEVGELPESWQVVKLRDIVTVKGGKRLPKGASFSEEPTNFPYIRVTDFRDGTVGTDDLKYLTPETQQAIRRYTIGSDDVYISIAGTIGLVGTIPQQLDGANLTENAAKLVINDKASLDGDFLALILRSQCGQRQIQNLTTKTTQPKLALMRIEQVLVPQPSIAEQREIASILRACESKLIGLGREITYLDELFHALLEELMTGRISVAFLIEEYRVQ